jgi:transposase-like protein
VKGLSRAIPFIYGIDFLTHDPIFGMMALAEDEGAFVTFFETVKAIGYPMRAVIADDVAGLRSALRLVYPGIPVQLCQVHVLRNIKEFLHLTVRTPAYRPFFDALRTLMPVSGEDARRRLFRAIADQYGNDPRAWEVLMYVEERWRLLFQYDELRKEGVKCPRTNNLIEAYNSHLQGRLASVKGFERVSSAAAWLDAWLLRRRFTPFRECGPPFKHLNHHTSFSQSRNPQIPWPEIFGLSPPEHPQKPTRN